MTRYNDALSQALADITWTPSDLAMALDVRSDTARKWLSGRLPTPPSIQEWIEDLADYHRAHPPPQRPPRAGDADDEREAHAIQDQDRLRD